MTTDIWYAYNTELRIYGHMSKILLSGTRNFNTFLNSGTKHESNKKERKKSGDYSTFYVNVAFIVLIDISSKIK